MANCIKDDREAEGRAINESWEKERKMKKTMEVTVVGVTFANRQSTIRDLSLDSKLSLFKDDSIVGHPYAIRVVTENKLCIGFLTDKDNESLAKRLSPLVHLIKVTEWHKVGGGNLSYGLRITLEWDIDSEKVKERKEKVQGEKVVETLDNNWVKHIDNGATIIKSGVDTIVKNAGPTLDKVKVTIKENAPKVKVFIKTRWESLGKIYNEHQKKKTTKV